MIRMLIVGYCYCLRSERQADRRKSRCIWRIAVQKSPSDRFLARTLKPATLVRIPLTSNFPADAVEMLRSGKADVFGAELGLIDAIAGSYPGALVAPGRVQQGVRGGSLPKGRSARWTDCRDTQRGKANWGRPKAHRTGRYSQLRPRRTGLTALGLGRARTL
jgi:hypothetical protein